MKVVGILLLLIGVRLMFVGMSDSASAERLEEKLLGRLFYHRTIEDGKVSGGQNNALGAILFLVGLFLVIIF